MIQKQKIVLTLIMESDVIVKRDIDVTAVHVKVRNLHNYIKRSVSLHRPNYSVLIIRPQNFIQTFDITLCLRLLKWKAKYTTLS